MVPGVSGWISFFFIPYGDYIWTLSQLFSAAAQGVTYIIPTDCTCTCTCPSLSNYYIYYIILYYIILYYITTPSIRYIPHWGIKKNDIQPDTPGTMVPCDTMRS